MSETPELPDVKQTWVFIGHVYNPKDKKLQQIFLPLDKEGIADDKDRRAFHKAVSHAFVGAVYEVTTQGNTIFIKGNKQPRFLRRYDDEDVVATWEALNRAEESIQEQERLLRKEGELSAFETALAPIVKAMRKTNYQGKRAIKVWVLEHLEKGGAL